MRFEMKREYGIIAIAVAFLFSLSVSFSAETKIEKIDENTILKTSEVWMENYENFDPQNELLERVKSRVGNNLKIDVYLGLWCPDSRNNVPKFLKIMDRLEAGVPVDYYTVQRKPNRSVKYYVEDMKVEQVPTFVFFRDGKEIGRIIENPKKSLLADFLEIISSPRG